MERSKITNMAKSINVFDCCRHRLALCVVFLLHKGTLQTDDSLDVFHDKMLQLCSVNKISIARQLVELLHETCCTNWFQLWNQDQGFQMWVWNCGPLPKERDPGGRIASEFCSVHWNQNTWSSLHFSCILLWTQTYKESNETDRCAETKCTTPNPTSCGQGISQWSKTIGWMFVFSQNTLSLLIHETTTQVTNTKLPPSTNSPTCRQNLVLVVFLCCRWIFGCLLLTTEAWGSSFTFTEETRSITSTLFVLSPPTR